ncbi:hypothetical protein Tco_0217164 [Tanacetum coccineum]
MKAVKEKEQLQKTVDSWKESSKNLWRLITISMSSNDKLGLGYETQSNDEVLSYEEEMNFSIFKCSKEDSIGKPLYNCWEIDCNRLNTGSNNQIKSGMIGWRTVKSIPPKCHLGFSRVLKGALDKVICKPDDISCRSVPGGSLQLVRETLAKSAPPMLDLDGSDHDLTEQNLKQCKGKIFDGHYTAAVRVLSSSGVAPYNDVTLYELKTKHRFMSAPSLPDLNIDHHPLIASQDVVLDRIKSFP